MNIMLYPVLSALHGTPGITHQQQDFHIQPATNQDRKIKQKYLQISVADPRLAVLFLKIPTLFCKLKYGFCLT